VLTALADGLLLADKTGSTPPSVVALHGWARSGADFAQVVDGLDAVSPHLPGFGTTEAPLNVWGSPEYADLVAEAIKDFGPVVIVAHSFGGRVAVHLAAKHPELVKGLVLTGVPLLRRAPSGGGSRTFALMKRLNKLNIVSDEQLEASRRKHGSADYNATQGIMRSIFVRVVNEDYREQLAALDLPVRMVWGENDTAAPTDLGRDASALIKGATFRVVPGAGHLLEGDLRVAVREELHAMIAEGGE
jgi:pimeloyl-ACP methyl ester carboxylesterase